MNHCVKQLMRLSRRWVTFKKSIFEACVHACMRAIKTERDSNQEYYKLPETRFNKRCVEIHAVQNSTHARVAVKVLEMVMQTSRIIPCMFKVDKRGQFVVDVFIGTPSEKELNNVVANLKKNDKITLISIFYKLRN